MGTSDLKEIHIELDDLSDIVKHQANNPIGEAAVLEILRHTITRGGKVFVHERMGDTSAADTKYELHLADEGSKFVLTPL